MTQQSDLIQIDKSKMSRRSFLRMGMTTLGALAALELGSAGLIYLRAHSLEGQFGSVITAGVVEDFPAGSVTEFANARFFLVRAPEGGFLAVHSRCPHLGCTVYWEAEEEKFYCPCHASAFDFYGNFENPPVPRPLDIFPVEIDAGMVKVDTARLQTREVFEPEQLAYAPQ
jgi:cytochrome b6-f complex iron-sulfur subunit